MMSSKSNIKFLCLLFVLTLVLPINCETKYNLGFWDFSNWFNFNKKNDQASTSSSLVGTRCVGCSNKLDDETTVQDELTLLRIEYIKQQILKKLRLKEKPTVSLPIAGLPKPVTENENLFPRNQDANENDHYYGKTTQAIIFPTEDETKCTRKKRNPSACLPFEIPPNLHSADISMAELWVHKVPDILDSHNQTFVVSEVAHWDTNRSFQKTKPIAIHETYITDGWLKINILWAVKNWLEYKENSHVLNVACKTCGMNANLSPISSEAALKPFLVIYTYSQPRKRYPSRVKRNINCVPGVNSCCREKLYVSFKEIGWDDWILSPAGYNAYFCRGSCEVAASVTLSGSHHNAVMQKIMYRPNRKLEFIPCCAPTQYMDLELLIIENKTLTTQLLPNMIVDTCGCM